MAEAICAQCGQSSTGKFCSNCGSLLESKKGVFSTIFKTFFEPFIDLFLNIKIIFYFKDFCKRVLSGFSTLKRGVILYFAYTAFYLSVISTLNPQLNIPSAVEPFITIIFLAVILSLAIVNHLMLRNKGVKGELYNYITATFYIQAAFGTLVMSLVFIVGILQFSINITNKENPLNILPLIDYISLVSAIVSAIYGLRILKQIYNKSYQRIFGTAIAWSLIVGAFVILFGAIGGSIYSEMTKNNSNELAPASAPFDETPVDQDPSPSEGESSSQN